MPGPCAGPGRAIERVPIQSYNCRISCDELFTKRAILNKNLARCCVQRYTWAQLPLKTLFATLLKERPVSRIYELRAYNAVRLEEINLRVRFEFLNSKYLQSFLCVLTFDNDRLMPLNFPEHIQVRDAKNLATGCYDISLRQ